MRRLLRRAFLLLGFILLVLGGAAAILAGPDDTVTVVSQEVGNSEGVPVVTAPALTAFADLDLVVTASAPGGVFVGSAHQVDVRSLVSGVEHFEVTQMLPGFVGGINGSAWEGDEFALPDGRDVADLDVWHHHASGETEQQIVIPLDGEPVRVFVLPAGEGSPTVTFAVRVAGLFVASLLTAAGGAALVVAGWFLRRRRGSSDAAAAEEQAADAHSSPEEADRPHATALRTTSARTTVALCVGSLALSGCAVPHTVAQGTPEKTALSTGSLEALVTSHAERRTKAVKEARYPKFDAGEWQGAFAGPMLEAAHYATSSDRAYEERSGRPEPTKAGERVWSPSFEAYPMWAFAEVKGLERPTPARWKTNEDKSKSRTKKAAQMTSLAVFVRESAADHWQAFSAVEVSKKSLPAPVAEPFSATPDEDTLTRADAATDRVKKWWLTGKRKGIVVDAESRRTLPNVRFFHDTGERRRTHLEFSEWSEEDERLRIVEVEDGHLVVQTSRLRVTLVSPPGYTLSWTAPLNTLKGKNERGPHTRVVLTSVIHLPAEGKPRLLGSDLATVLG